MGGGAEGAARRRRKEKKSHKVGLFFAGPHFMIVVLHQEVGQPTFPRMAYLLSVKPPYKLPCVDRRNIDRVVSSTWGGAQGRSSLEQGGGAQGAKNKTTHKVDVFFWFPIRSGDASAGSGLSQLSHGVPSNAVSSINKRAAINSWVLPGRTEPVLPQRIHVLYAIRYQCGLLGNICANILGYTF